MRRLLISSAVILALGGAFLVGSRMSAKSRPIAAVAAPGVVDQVRTALADAYYRPVPASVLRLASVRKMISALDDPYTVYMGPSTYRLVRQETASTYSGIGAGVLPAGRKYVVVSLRSGPALRAGVHIGDIIEEIDGTVASRLSMSAVVARILGRPGTDVHLVIDRSGRRIDLTVRRATIHAPAVTARLVSLGARRWGVVHVTEFAVGTAVLLRREVRMLQRQGAKGLVLDLRDDPGGLLTQAVTVTSVFIDRGVIVTLQGAHQPQQALSAIPGRVTHLPLVVLVDRYTASAAEIVAAALRDHHRATIVGERTFGKALVQAVDPLENGAALKLSVAHYTTPSGEDLAGIGITPQIRARDDPRTADDEALGTALSVLARPTS